MKLRFLCGPHLEYLQSNPSAALALWETGFDTAQSFYDTHLWGRALPHIGCAFETADIVLTSHIIERTKAYELLTSSTVMLAFTLLKLGKIKDAQNTYCHTISRLERDLSIGGVAYLDLQESLGFLYKCAQNVTSMMSITEWHLGLQEEGSDSLGHRSSIS